MATTQLSVRGSVGASVFGEAGTYCETVPGSLPLPLLLLLIPVTLGGLWLGWRSLMLAAREVRLWVSLGRARMERFDALRPGPATLRGRVVPLETVASPYSGHDGVYVAYALDRWDRLGSATALGGKWLRADADEVVAPFELSDGRSRVR